MSHLSIGGCGQSEEDYSCYPCFDVIERIHDFYSHKRTEKDQYIT